MGASVNKQSHANPQAIEPTNNTGLKVTPECPAPVNTCPAGKVVDENGDTLFWVPTGATVVNPVECPECPECPECIEEMTITVNIDGVLIANEVVLVEEDTTINITFV